MNGMCYLIWALAATVALGAAESVTENKPAAPAGPVLRWSFDEGQGTAAKADDGKTTLKVLGASWVKGVEGGAVSLDGEFTYLKCPDQDLPASFPGKADGKPGSFTIACWVRTRTDRHRHPIVVKQGNLTRGFMFCVEHNDQLAVQLSASEDLRTELKSVTRITTRKWYHVAVTYLYNGQGRSVMRLYVNGKEDVASTSAVGPAMSNDLPLEIGHIQWSSAYSRFLAGRLDDLRFYDRALSTDEIAELAKQPSAAEEDEEE